MKEPLELNERQYSGSEDEEEEEEVEEEEEEQFKEYAKCPSADGEGSKQEDNPMWDMFRYADKEEGSMSMADTKLVDYCITVLKLTAYAITFCGVLFGGVASKVIMLLMTSQLTPDKSVTLKRDHQYLQMKLPEVEKHLWIWALFVSFIVPEIGTFVRSLRHIYFKGFTRQEVTRDRELTPWVVTFTMESLHVGGLALFVFQVLPNIDVVKGAMLTNCVCLVPGILSVFSAEDKTKSDCTRIVFDVIAVLSQLSGLFLWTSLEPTNYRLWFIPLALLLVSCGWWMNFANHNSKFKFIRVLSDVKAALKDNDVVLYKVYVWVSIYKIALFGFISCGILALQGFDLGSFFNVFASFDNNRTMIAYRLTPVTDHSFLYSVSPNDPCIVNTIGLNIWWLVAVQVLSSYFCYVCSKFAYKIMISSIGFALPVMLVVPSTITLIIVATAFRYEDPTVFNNFIPPYVYFNAPSVYSLKDFFLYQAGITWIIWLISQTWITLHVWTPKCERLSRTEKLFATPMYSDILIDQSIVLNRRRDKFENKTRTEECPHIIACATMWHESKPEMVEMMKSLLRMDQDHGYRESAYEHLKPKEETNRYGFEAHIFFDDAFEIENEESENMVINKFVKDLIEVINTLVVQPQGRDEKQQKWMKYGTPYGGKLLVILPMGTELHIHLKNKDKIRHRKRWSQVMYMYYLLGYNLMEKELKSEREKLLKAENVFLLALDGDIDFKPEAVLLLVDLMKKDPNVGAACGRIHPVGGGFMVWYQAFEYAIGHWLQKATEHMIGCVLCSPGCFSLFRGRALMADNVMKTYTTKAEEARHYVQYDQGEDRWLCTLLLQRGYRVEYCAASDAFTHCPESFNEFYTQRRRWVPSTMANILDLLYDYKHVVKINNDISMLYIAYQLMLMVGTVLGPGTIFLLLVSAFNAAFKIDNWTSFYYNMIPILLYLVICLTMKGDLQLISALIISGIYGLIMMAVLVGMLMQISEDGFLAPSTIFLYIVAGEIIIAGIIHPQEFLCLLSGPIYYVTIPSMYLLLIIYSVCNLNQVTWGTREVKQKKTKAELEEEKKEAEEQKKKAQKTGSFHSLLENFGGKKKTEERGAIEFSLGNIFRCMLFSSPKEESGTKELHKMNDTLVAMTTKLENVERYMESGTPYSRLQKSVSYTSIDVADLESKDRSEKTIPETNEVIDEKDEERDDLANPYWIEAKALKIFSLGVLDMNETSFWKDLIKKYLEPIMEDKEKKKEIAKSLKELRDRMVVTFFMLNALFVTVVFLLQLNKSNVHLNWPLDAKINMSFTDDKHIRITKTYLELEPVGVLFIVFFAIILVIQFLAMLFHRFETLCHLLSSTPMRFPWKEKVATFEMQINTGRRRVQKLSSCDGVPQNRNMKDMADSIFSRMKQETDEKMTEKLNKKRSSMLWKMKENNPLMNKTRHLVHYKSNLIGVIEEDTVDKSKM